MSKIAVIYHTTKHGNTKKVLDAMQEVREMDLLTVEEAKTADLTQYEYLGFASGVYYWELSKPLLKLLKGLDLSHVRGAFIVYTCGKKARDFTSKPARILAQKKVRLLGSFDCLGFDTYGPLGWIGGVNKGRPDEKDLENARAFARKVPPAD